MSLLRKLESDITREIPQLTILFKNWYSVVKSFSEKCTVNYKSRRNRWSIIKVGETSLKRILNKNFCKILIKAYQVLVQYHKNTFLVNKIMFISKVKLINNINNSLSEKIFVINLDKIANIQNIRQDLFLSRPVHTEVLLTGF